MTQEVKDEALDQLNLDIKFGFENEEELFESIREMFYNEKDFDEAWLKQTILEKCAQHHTDSLLWARPTDFDKLVKTFDELIEQKIVCLHKAGFTRQDGEGDCMETIERLNELSIKAIGFCYYHTQDLERAINPDTKSLLLGFGSPIQDEVKALEIGNKIVETLKKNEFQVSWTGSVDERLEIKNINWQKTPDNEEWGAERVIKILSKELNDKKPFWKFW